MNETAQHTPGPWRTVPTAAKSAGLSRLDVVTDALPFAPSFVAGDILPEDAHLIAAAPDLEDAALFAWSVLVDLSNGHKVDTNDAIAKLDAAIAKSKGRA